MRFVAIISVLVLMCSSHAVAADAPSATSVPVLDLSRGSFRVFLAWRTSSLVSPDGKLKPLLDAKGRNMKESDRKPLLIRQSAGPAAEWASVEFNDTDWPRVRGAAAVQSTRGWDRVWVRGAFVVSDPAKVKGLKLNLAYFGGVVAYINGVELVRVHLPALSYSKRPKGEPRTFAKQYPAEAYVRPDGKLYAWRDGRTFGERMRVRVRRLAGGGVAIPSKMLRKGINIVAVRSVGAPIAEVASTAPQADTRRPPPLWPHAGLLRARLVATAPNGLTPSVGPAPGVAIGNVSPVETVFAWDHALPSEKLRPVRLIGAKNGAFSGRVILSSSEKISGLKASATDLALKGGGGSIPAAAVQIRWASAAQTGKTWVPAGRFDALLDEPPAEVPVRKITLRRVKVQPPAAAVAPVWITVRVPADAVAGEYKGTVTVEAGGSKFAVPVEIKVHDWAVPDPKDFAIVNNTYHSPDTVARFYKVPLWSEKHCDLMGQSLDILKQVGSRICILNLVVKAHSQGNTESMIKWVKQADGTYKYDFSIAEKYMDVFAKAVGKPRILQLNAWGFQGDNPAKPKWPPEGVTVVDTNGKRLADLVQPAYGTPENEAFWRPVFVELRKRLEKRGWLDVTLVGWLNYCNDPPGKMVEVVKNIWPDAKWIKNAHAPAKVFRGSKGSKVSMPVKCAAWVWGCGGLYDPDCTRPWAKPPVYYPNGRKAYPQPWKSVGGHIKLGIPRLGVEFTKPGLYDISPLFRVRMIAEAVVQANLHGIGMVGGDFWPVPSGRRGRFTTMCDNKGGVGPRNNTKAFMSPGPKGPVFSERLETFREGIQTAEAIVLLQKALDAKTVGGALARKIEDLLDERARQYIRNCTPTPKGPGQDSTWMTMEATNWLDRNEELFALAAEVAGKIKGK
jgi:glycosyl hydrolase family 123